MATLAGKGGSLCFQLLFEDILDLASHQMHP